MAASKPIGTETTDIASLWREALKNYYETTGQDLRTLPRFTSVSDIMNDTQLKNDHFDNFRHDKGKVDKLRSAITRNSDLVMKGAQYIAQAATPACKDVSADYDKITSFFDEMNNFLERVSIIESRMPSVPAYKVFLTRVFSSMMNLLAIATKAVKKGRFKKWFKTLLEGGGDDDLAGAYGTMETALKRLESATNFATLGNTEDIKKDTKDIIVTTERVDMKTQKIDMTTQNIQVSVQEGFLQVTELQSQLAENFAKMMEHQKKESAKRAAPTQQHKPRDPGTRKHAAFSFVRRFFLKPAVLAEQARDIESSFVHGTAEWIFQEEAYETWASHEKSILFLLGGPGVGKSNLAFSAIQKLSQIADYDTRTSVAYFYFKDEQEELRYMSKATTCIIRQLAEQDPIYCEQVAAELNKTEDDLDTVNWQALWEDYILSKFPSDTEGHAYLIIDGLDEAASSAEKKSFLELLQKLRAGESNVHVLVTLRPITEYSPQSEKLSYTELNITKEQISVDFPTLIDARMDRLKGLSKICKFRKQVKRKIRTELQQKADGMLFIEHMLRRYNSIGREGAVLKDMVNFCPTDLSSLYALMLSECQGRRSPNQYQSLKKLFSWLAFSRRPLSLNEASALVALTGQDSSFSIEEELEGKSARILEISTPLGAGDVSDASDNEDDEKDENLARDDGSFPLRFQERSLREYFQAMSVDDEGLRTSPSTAHLTIFENAVSIICGISTNSTQLSAYSAKFWCSHFLNIDPSAVSERDTARVIENLALILSNHNDASKLIEKFGSHYTSIFGNAPADSPFPNNFLNRVQEWLDRAHSENGGLSEVASAWVQNTKASPKKMMVPLAEAHVKNWISGPYADVMRKSSGFALDALSMTDLISPTTSKQRTNPSAELLISVTNIFDIVRDARSYRCIGLVITNYGHYEASLDYFQKSLELSSVDDVRSFYNRVSIAKAHMDLTDSNDEDDDDQPHVTAAYENIKEALKIEYHPENDKTRQDIANQKRVALLSRAKCERRLRKFDDARVSYEEAKDILPTVTMPGAVLNRWTILLTDEQLLDTLAKWTLWDRMSWLTFIDNGDEEDGDDEIEFKDPNDRFQEAAKKLGKLDFMVETYQQIIAYKIRFKQAGYPRLQLAHAFRDVIGDAKKAKELLYDIMDSDSCIDPYTGDEDFDTVLDTRFEISDILYEEFRASSDPIAKIAVLEEYKRIPERRLARSINMFGIYDSQTAIIAARMTKLVGTATEYQEILERTFQSCMDGLTDTEGWNDTSSLRLLAKALVCVGMNKEAQMALSAQFSIIDPDVSHSDYSSDESDSEGSSENEDGSSDDDEGSEEGGDGASAAKTQSSGKKTAEEDDTEDIAPDSHIFCNGECKKPEHATWKDGPMYSCLVCTDCDLCESCYQIQTARNLGEPHEFWRSYCGKNHRYIKAPIEGWKGIKDGVMTIGEEKTKFTEWLNDLENKWKEAWKRFWLNEGLQNDIV